MPSTFLEDLMLLQTCSKYEERAQMLPKNDEKKGSNFDQILLLYPSPNKESRVNVEFRNILFTKRLIKIFFNLCLLTGLYFQKKQISELKDNSDQF